MKELVSELKVLETGLSVEGVILYACIWRFYSAMLCIRGTSHGPVSVSVCDCLSVSVTSRSSTKTAKQRIT